MNKLTYPAMIPSQKMAKLGHDLNILVVAENGYTEEVHVKIRIGGKLTESGKMTLKICAIPA